MIGNVSWSWPNSFDKLPGPERIVSVSHPLFVKTAILSWIESQTEVFLKDNWLFERTGPAFDEFTDPFNRRLISLNSPSSRMENVVIYCRVPITVELK